MRSVLLPHGLPEQSRALSQMWTALGEEERAVYQKGADEDKLRYEAEMARYRKTLPADKPQTGADSGKPKKATTAFAEFCRETRESIKAENPTLPGPSCAPQTPRCGALRPTAGFSAAPAGPLPTTVLRPPTPRLTRAIPRLERNVARNGRRSAPALCRHCRQGQRTLAEGGWQELGARRRGRRAQAPKRLFPLRPGPSPG